MKTRSCSSSSSSGGSSIISSRSNTRSTSACLENMPDELLQVIYSYLIHKDRFSTYERYFATTLSLAYVCKSFYSLFKLKNEDKVKLLHLYRGECAKKICKSTIKSMYSLTDNEIDAHIQLHSIVRNPHYRSASGMRLYKLTDVIDYCYGKYHTEAQYQLMIASKMERKEERKVLNNDKRSKRQSKVSELNEKYSDFLAAPRVDSNSDMLIQYGIVKVRSNIIGDITSYTTSGSPGIKGIKERILQAIDSIARCTNLKNLLLANSVTHRKTVATLAYVLNNTCTVEDAYQSIVDVATRENEVKDAFINAKINFNINHSGTLEYLDDNIGRLITYDYIQNNAGSAESIVDTILSKRRRKADMKEALLKHNIGLSYKALPVDVAKYIEDGEGSIEKIVLAYVHRSPAAAQSINCACGNTPSLVFAESVAQR